MWQGLIGAGTGLGIGVFVGLLIAPTPQGTPSVVECDTVRGEPVVQIVRAPASRPQQMASDDSAAALHNLVEALESQVAELEQELYGDPNPWPEEIPEPHQPDVFAANVVEIFAECDIPVDVVGFRCEEPPCYTMLRRDEQDYDPDDPWFRALQSCASWDALYGLELSFATHTVTCPDGREEGFTMLAPEPSWLIDFETDPDTAEHFMRRFDVRLRTAKMEWPCLSDAGDAGG